MASTDDFQSLTAADITFEKKLGGGFFGEVYRARLKNDVVPGRLFAVKKVRLNLITENRLEEQMQREVQILYALQHPRIVRLFFNFQDPLSMYLGMEFVRGGTLFQKLNLLGKLDAKTAARHFHEVCEALDYIHHLPEPVIHRDIKPENILLDAEDRAKLADFGWANLIEAGGPRTTFCGTLDYLPPEMITGTGHDASADMWNMGVLLYELLIGDAPFASSTKETTCRLILSGDLRFPASTDMSARELIAKLCKKDGAQRLKVREAMSHAFIRSAMGTVEGAQESSSETFQLDPVCAAAAAATEAQGAQPSVAARKLQDEAARRQVEKELLLKAKQTTEDNLKKVSEELERTNSSIRKEHSKRIQVEAQCTNLEIENRRLEKDLEELRKQVKSLESKLERARSPRRGLLQVIRNRLGRRVDSA